MARLYADENFPRPVADELRRLGHDVVTLQETGEGGKALADLAVLRFAHADGRAVVTLNRKHFIALHGASPAHSGIIVCTFDLDFIGQATRIDEAIRLHDQLQGRLVRITRPSRSVTTS